jgi:methylmalonyl-CoA/ethylmalonyl-CoA epimerase
MPRILKINHIAIVVENIEQALEFWHKALGLNLDHVQEMPEQESVVAFMTSGESEIELVTPTTDSSGISRYLQKRGPGMHHICLEVDDIQGMLNHIKELNITLINDTPLVSKDGKKYAFIHPESAQGVLVELYELPRKN